jgi:hypothetical protein
MSQSEREARKNKKLVPLESEVSISVAASQIASSYLCEGRRYSASEQGKKKREGTLKRARASPPLRHNAGLVTQDPDAS